MLGGIMDCLTCKKHYSQSGKCSEKDAETTSKHYVAKSKKRIKKECEKYMAA